MNGVAYVFSSVVAQQPSTGHITSCWTNKHATNIINVTKKCAGMSFSLEEWILCHFVAVCRTCKKRRASPLLACSGRMSTSIPPL